MKLEYVFSLVTLIILPLGLLSCTDTASTDEKAWNLVLRDGLLYKDSLATEPFTGHYKGKVMGKVIEYDVVNGKKDGVFAIYHENGNVETLGYLKEDKNHGEWKYFYPNGVVESVGIFKSDKPDSIWNWFYMTGTLRQEGEFVDGKREGKWNYYDDFGNLYLTMKFKDDVVRDSIVYEISDSISVQVKNSQESINN